jgi:hypothetical protein
MVNAHGVLRDPILPASAFGFAIDIARSSRLARIGCRRLLESAML